jgi:hypothetical protein
MLCTRSAAKSRLASKSSTAPGRACTVLAVRPRSAFVAASVNGSVAKSPATLLVHVSHSDAVFSAAAVAP